MVQKYCQCILVADMAKNHKDLISLPSLFSTHSISGFLILCTNRQCYPHCKVVSARAEIGLYIFGFRILCVHRYDPTVLRSVNRILPRLTYVYMSKSIPVTLESISQHLPMYPKSLHSHIHSLLQLIPWISTQDDYNWVLFLHYWPSVTILCGMLSFQRTSAFQSVHVGGMLGEMLLYSSSNISMRLCNREKIQ